MKKNKIISTDMMGVIISRFFLDDCSEEMKIEGLKRLITASIPLSFHHKVADICFRCLERPSESSTVKTLAKRLLMRLIEGYPRLADRI